MKTKIKKYIAKDTKLEYTITNNNEVYISGFGENIDADLVIPEYVDGLRVDGISTNAFEGVMHIRSVHIPTLKYFGGYVFANCKSLTKVTFDENNGIGNGMFCDCTKLQSVVFNGIVRYIDCGAFAGCTSLSDISLPEGMTKIYNRAFERCEALETITIPSTIIKIEPVSFIKSGIRELVIPDNVKCVGGSAFAHCHNLTRVVLGSNVEMISARAFEDCPNLVSFEFNDGLETIEKEAFSGCKSLKHLALPITITNISDMAFRECVSLKQVTIPGSVSELGVDAFMLCSELTSIMVSSALSMDMLNQAFRNCKNLMEVKMFNSFMIGKKLFSDYKNLTTFTNV